VPRPGVAGLTCWLGSARFRSVCWDGNSTATRRIKRAPDVSGGSWLAVLLCQTSSACQAELVVLELQLRAALSLLVCTFLAAAACGLLVMPGVQLQDLIRFAVAGSCCCIATCACQDSCAPQPWELGTH
jgi:hypothetical protein